MYHTFEKDQVRPVAVGHLVLCCIQKGVFIKGILFLFKKVLQKYTTGIEENRRLKKPSGRRPDVVKDGADTRAQCMLIAAKFQLYMETHLTSRRNKIPLFFFEYSLSISKLYASCF